MAAPTVVRVQMVYNGAPSRRTLRYNIHRQMKFAGAVRGHQANELRNTGMLRLRR